jgi:hypothetical protein
MSLHTEFAKNRVVTFGCGYVWARDYNSVEDEPKGDLGVKE